MFLKIIVYLGLHLLLLPGTQVTYYLFCQGNQLTYTNYLFFPPRGPIKGHLGSNLPPTVSTTSVRSVRLLKTNKTHVLRCELVKKRITHSRSAVANGSATARPKINAESTVDVTANSQEWTVVKPPWK